MNCNQRLALAVSTLSGADGTPETEEATLQAALDELFAAIEEGAELDAPDEEEMRAVDLLASGRSDPWAAAALQALVESGAEVGIGPLPGLAPPLHVACHRGAVALVQGLLMAGAQADLKANAMSIKLLGGTPAHAAVLGFRAARGQDYGQVISLLIRAGADLDARDRRGARPVDAAALLGAQAGSTDLLRALMNYGVKTLAEAGAASVVSAGEIAQALAGSGREPDMAALANASHLRQVVRTRRAVPG